ncbi:hypothetical protein [Maritalea porphyrae]|uniref:hypothetical protein n=1 Tax=Maritalea porphyrae TaxID=880732 RepID=UPI0022AF89A8|nr:hypothetical protein [Maritalea porphyrae]MCZ4273302.1 hypothetical protein [Maritalea porphyrae]
MSNKAVEKLKKSKQENSGNDDFTLPSSGVKVEWPKFLEHGDWQRSLRMSKNDIHTAQALYVCKIATFDGEKITVADWGKYVPINEANELLAKIFVGDDESDSWDEEVGNEAKTKA